MTSMSNNGKFAALAVSAALALGACGLKGDLYLEENAPLEPAVESTVEPSTEAQPAP